MRYAIRFALLVGVAFAPTLASAQNVAGSPAPTSTNVLTAFGGPSGVATILYAPSTGDDVALRDAISAACGGAVVDYFNATNGTPTVATMQGYDLVFTWANFAYDDAIGFGNALAQYADSGGRVILGAFCTYTLGNSLDGKIMEPEYCPVVSPTGGNHFEVSEWGGLGKTCVHTCIEAYEAFARDELSAQGLGQIDSTFVDGEIAVAYRTDRRVWYFNGYGQAQAAGDWPQMVCQATDCGDVRSMLIFDDTVSSTIAQAAADDGFWVRPAATGALFATLVDSFEWDIVAVDSSLNLLPPEIGPALSAHVAGGGRAIASYWDLDGSSDAALASDLRNTFGVETATSFSAPQFVYDWTDDGHPVWEEPNTPISISVDSDTVNDNGDQLAPAFGAYAVGGFSSTPFPGAAAVIVGNQCRTIINGFLSDDMDPSDRLEIAQNQVRYLMSRNGTLLLERGPNRRVARRAAERVGETPALARTDAVFVEELATCDFDMVIVDPPCCGLSTDVETALASYVAGGGRVLFSYWDLDSSPSFQSTFGVSGTTDISAPQPVFHWSLGHPIFTAPNFVSNPISTAEDSFWFDNGDLMTVAPGATGLGGFTASTTVGQAAIILDNGNRTIINGFDYDSMDDCDTVDLLENQLVFLSGPPTISPFFRRGDCNTDAGFDVSDPVFLLSELFAAGPEGTCRDACDANDDGGINIADAVFMLGAQFVPMAPQPPAPFPGCGIDPTPDAMGCASYPLCL